jgi:S-layer protein
MSYPAVAGRAPLGHEGFVMAYSTAQLEALFTNANMGEVPDAATALLLSGYAAQTLTGALTQDQALSDALHIPPPSDGSVGPNTPEDTTDVAVAVYQFFTGMAPTLAGLSFLVNGGGNPNDLDSPYYAGFNQANRYYNFAINLITGNAAARPSFQSHYGALSFDQTVSTAYEAIVGAANVGSAAAAAAIAAIEAQLSYFQHVAAERAPSVSQDLATKAIAIAYILEEAVKADVGYYASAIDQFDTALANGSPTGAETASGIDLLTAYPIQPGEPTALVANLGDASVTIHGAAAAGFVDVFTGGNGTDTIIGTTNGGDTRVSLGTSPGPGPGDSVVLSGGAHNVVSIGNGNESSVTDASNGADTITLGNGAGDQVVLSGAGTAIVTLGDGSKDFVNDTGSGANTIHLGAGAGDEVVVGSGTDVVTLGAGAGDEVVFNATGISSVSFAGTMARVDLSQVVTASFATPTTTSQTDILTNHVNVISGFVHGDSFVLPVGDLVMTADNLAGVAGHAAFTTGTYNAAAGTFDHGSGGPDALLTYDAGGSSFVSVVLVGGAAEIGHATASGDVITF